jgi:hypothetical protein
MSDGDAIAAEIEARISEVRARIDSVTEGHRRWNRLEEAMDTVAEEVINLLDDVGRNEQATEISSMLAAHERFDALLEIVRRDTGLATEADAADHARSYAYCRGLLEALDRVAEPERKHRPF